ncbi:MATE family efflux transporter [Rhizobium sp. L1K21]|uniref:MATE family efflux transporter n=1 Tax=Rhizobium sp. L1K21 TaxID=2954933 RepID=UPI0020920B82|nr:MATE family efflux transporter [Rhizobium sp. L1K21]MCO6186904.1 MATE family efflux transporter [Rhizobium sp. L1K21]
MSMIEAPRANPYLSGPVPAVYFKTVLPIAFFMIVNGLYTVVDALFLGIYAGADALTAVTLAFPMFMLLVALSTMLGSGMASIVARYIGGDDLVRAKAAFLSSHSLALVVSLVLAIGFTAFGAMGFSAAASGNEAIARQGWQYVAILTYTSPLMFFLSIQGDEMRSEGKAGIMALIGVAATLFNIVFNYIFIAMLDMGTAGSAWGTVAAQTLAFAGAIALRFSGRMALRMDMPQRGELTYQWRDMLALGLPPSLSFAGIALNSAVIITMLNVWGGENTEDTIAAYGIFTRILTFGFMPVLSFNLAAQSMAGNNYGAGEFQRSNKTLVTALLTAFIYAALFELLLIAFADPIGRLFVDNEAVVSEISRIVPVAMMAYALNMPLFVIAGYYQALGIAWAAGAMSLIRTYLIAVPLGLIMPYFFGEPGIWLAWPIADISMLAVCVLVLARVSKMRGARLGLFFQAKA